MKYYKRIIEVMAAIFFGTSICTCVAMILAVPLDSESLDTWDFVLMKVLGFGGIAFFGWLVYLIWEEDGTFKWNSKL